MTLENVDILSDAVILNFLKKEHIGVDGEAASRKLRLMAKVRLQRLARVEARRAVHGRVFGLAHAKHVAELIEKMDDMARLGYQEKVFTKLKFIIDDYTDSIITCKHGVGEGDCKGKVRDGRCQECGADTIGVASYYFRLSVMDVRVGRADSKLDIPCFKSMGEAIFKMTAESAKNLSQSEIDDLFEPWCGVAVSAGIVLKPNDARGGEVDLIPYALRALPDDYLV